MPALSSVKVLCVGLSANNAAWIASDVCAPIRRTTTRSPSASHASVAPGPIPSLRRTEAGTDTWPCAVSLLVTFIRMPITVVMKEVCQRRAGYASERRNGMATLRTRAASDSGIEAIAKYRIAAALPLVGADVGVHDGDATETRAALIEREVAAVVAGIDRRFVLCSACVRVGPPLAASGASCGSDRIVPADNAIAPSTATTRLFAPVIVTIAWLLAISAASVAPMSTEFLPTIELCAFSCSVPVRDSTMPPPPMPSARLKATVLLLRLKMGLPQKTPPAEAALFVEIVLCSSVKAPVVEGPPATTRRRALRADRHVALHCSASDGRIADNVDAAAGQGDCIGCRWLFLRPAQHDRAAIAGGVLAQHARRHREIARDNYATAERMTAVADHDAGRDRDARQTRVADGGDASAQTPSHGRDCVVTALSAPHKSCCYLDAAASVTR